MHYTLTTHRLFGYFALSLRVNGKVSEEELSSTYEEFGTAFFTIIPDAEFTL